MSGYRSLVGTDIERAQIMAVGCRPFGIRCWPRLGTHLRVRATLLQCLDPRQAAAAILSIGAVQSPELLLYLQSSRVERLGLFVVTLLEIPLCNKGGRFGNFRTFRSEGLHLNFQKILQTGQSDHI